MQRLLSRNLSVTLAKALQRVEKVTETMRLPLSLVRPSTLRTQSKIHDPTDGDLLEDAEYVNTVPLAGCGTNYAITQRSVSGVWSVRKVQVLLELLGVLNRLRALHTRRPIYVEPRVDDDHVPNKVR
ncbi:hypothetical protein C6341_g7302 [Phytophthora cactorum]|nr:hypothetical protein C6341_g7302 [Phytophthora cactorum]